MIDFLLKSSVCLAVFLCFYHLVLEKEKTHQFNRFYLLASILVSFCIPFITYEIIKPIENVVQIETATVVSQTPILLEETNYFPILLWSLYGIVTLLFAYRFLKNGSQLLQKSKSQNRISHQNATLVLIDEKVLPHTFLNTIFINKNDYENRNIEEELYTHELVHVQQKHSLDVLFIEILKVIFWFNPLFYFYKKAIQLNHEFLADEKVVATFNNVPFYQNLLLQKGFQTQNIALASNLNYLVTKKRLLMMTKKTSKTITVLNKIAIIPVVTLLFYFFCVQVVAQESKVATAKVNLQETVSEKEYFKGVRFKYYKTRTKGKNGYVYNDLIIDKIYEELDELDKFTLKYLLIVPKIIQKKAPTVKEFKNFKDATKYAVWIDGLNVANNKLDKYKPNDIAYFSGSVVMKNARTKKHPQYFQYHFFTHAYFDKNNMGRQKTKHEGKGIIGWGAPIDPNLYLEYLKEQNIPQKEQVEKVSEPNISENGNEIFNTAGIDKAPNFVGGMQAFYTFIGENFKISDEANKNNVNGKVFITFIVEKDGSLSEFKILRDIGFGTGDEAVRVLSSSPKWLPGEKDGAPVRVQYSLPITVRSTNK